MSGSPSSVENSNRDTSEATNNLISGKRFLLVNDYVSAVESLQEACHLFAKHYGDTAIECAEPYLYYGKALLELSRMETGVLGNALEGVSPEEEDDDDDEEEDDDQVENPDKVTGEEREQIIKQVEAAIDENSRDLDEKMSCQTNGVATGHATGDSSKELCTDPMEECSKDGSLEAEKAKAVPDNASVTDKASSKDADRIEDAGKLEVEKTVAEVVSAVTKPEGEIEKAEASSQNLVGDESCKEETGTSSSNMEDKKKDCDEEKMDDEAQENEEEENATEESESTGEKSQDEDVAQEDDGAGPSTSTGVSKTGKEEEEVSNLQLAWEMLELSKVIFKRQSEIDGAQELKVAEVLLKLGEVSIESENYEQAVEDLNACFNIQKKHLASYDRALAETLYQLGLATSFSNQFERAIESFTNSMKVLEERIAVLKQSLEDQEKDTKTVAANTAHVNDKTAQKDNAKSDDNKSNVEKCSESSSTNGEDAKKENAPSSEESKKNVPSSEADKKESAPSSEETKSTPSSDDTKKETAPSSGDAKNENSSSSEDSVEDPLLSIRQEIEELEELIPDIRTKIEDTEDMMKNAVQSVEEALTEISQIPVTKSPCKTEEKAKPISNISHLVKRKRKPEDDCSSADTSNDLKKPRPSEEIEESHVNGEMVVNGDSKPMETEESVKLKVKASVETQPETKKAVA